MPLPFFTYTSQVKSSVLTADIEKSVEDSWILENNFLATTPVYYFSLLFGHFINFKMFQKDIFSKNIIAADKLMVKLVFIYH